MLDGVKDKTFMMYRTHHGPITHANDDKWVSTALMWSPIKALEQSFTRSKKSGHDEFYEMMDIRTNSSNNTVYADADGTIAYYHGNFIPKRNEKFDYTKPVDGSNPETDWDGLHPLEDNIMVLNPLQMVGFKIATQHHLQVQLKIVLKKKIILNICSSYP